MVPYRRCKLRFTDAGGCGDIVPGRMRYTVHPLTVVFATLLLVTAMAPTASAQTPGAAALRVGAARIDVTPSPGELPKNIRGILDRLYARAIVLEIGRAP